MKFDKAFEIMKNDKEQEFLVDKSRRYRVDGGILMFKQIGGTWHQECINDTVIELMQMDWFKVNKRVTVGDLLDSLNGIDKDQEIEVVDMNGIEIKPCKIIVKPNRYLGALFG